MAESTRAYIDRINTEYDRLHKAFEDNFWATKMDLKGNSADELTKTKNEYEGFLRDQKNLDSAREMLKKTDLTAEEQRVLKIMEKTYLCYMMETEDATKLKEKTVGLESALEIKRNGMKLGYTHPKTKEFVTASSIQLGNTMVTDDDEEVRKACYDAMRTIPPFIAEDFCEIIKLRNKTSKANGYADYYEYKVQTMEGFDKKRLFEILDDLEKSTKPMLEAAMATLERDYGKDALKGWNKGYKLAGDLIKESDPYYPFDDAVSMWARSFAALGIDYKNSVMNLDLCDREKKYSNGFCHWPVCPYVKSDGTVQACVTNFTSLATPTAVGSGEDAIETLMHEGGHAAAFANIHQPSPFFAQERPPMSVAYAESQSMFLDALVGDPAWLARYAVSKEGKPMPWELIEKQTRKTHPYKVFAMRSMLRVPYYEKALYELPEDEVTPETIQRLSDEIDAKLTGGCVGSPCMSIPHIISDESSCYYQGYILADLCVDQTRHHFKQKYGQIVDNPQIGKDLSEIYWKPGSSESFLDLVKEMTGEPLTSKAYVARVTEDLDSKLKRLRAEYDEALKAGPKYTDDEITPLLKMRMRLVHGDVVVSDSETDGFKGAIDKYKAWLPTVFPPEKKE